MKKPKREWMKSAGRATLISFGLTYVSMMFLWRYLEKLINVTADIAFVTVFLLLWPSLFYVVLTWSDPPREH